MSKVGLARIFGVSQTLMQNKFSGRVRWTAEDIAALALLCEVPMETFFKRSHIVIDDEPLASFELRGRSSLAPIYQLRRVQSLTKRDNSRLGHVA